MKSIRGNFILVLIILITIIIVVGAVICPPNYYRARAAGMYHQCQSNCKMMGTVLEEYADDHKGYYPKRLTDLTPGYIRSLPTCAASESNTGYIKSYRRSKNYQSYIFYCAGNHHKILRVQLNYPQYSSETGLISTGKRGNEPESLIDSIF